MDHTIGAYDTHLKGVCIEDFPIIDGHWKNKGTQEEPTVCSFQALRSSFVHHLSKFEISYNAHSLGKPKA